MNSMKYVLSATLMSAVLSAAPVHAENGENGAIIGGIIGGLIGGAIGNQAPDFPGGGRGGPGGPPGHGGPGFPPGHGGPGGGWPGHGGPGGPGPGPGFPPPQDLCSGVYYGTQGNYVQYVEQGNGYVNVTAVANQYAYYGSGTCYQSNPSQAQFQFTIQFGGANHLNRGVMYIGQDGHAYMCLLYTS